MLMYLFVLQDLFTFNQHLLDALGVGHPAISKACSLASSLGLSTKLTGGGGGGCVIAIIPQGTCMCCMCDNMLVLYLHTNY